MNASADSQKPPNWNPWQPGWKLGPKDIGIWWTETHPDDTRLPSWWNLLDETERARADARRLTHARAAFIAAHGLLRTILGDLLRVGPATLAFHNQPQGRPVLASDHGGYFSLSRSGTTVLLAAARVPEIGIDVETIQPLPDLAALASQYFAPDEAQQIEAAPHATQAFYRCWTRKEAFVKATGLGLALPLDSFSVSVAGEARLLRHPAGDRQAAEWTLLDCQPDAASSAALAVRLRSPEVNYFRLP